MILTGDNLLRFVKEKKAVTPMMVSEAFEISTMIASAALSDLHKKNLIAITNLKLSTSPYYYDTKQNSILIELGLKHLSGYEKEVFLKLKENEVINSTSLKIPEKLAIEKIKDFAKEINIEHNNKSMKFWVWYQRNLTETKKQIMDILNSNSKPKNNVKKIAEPKINKNIIKEIPLNTNTNSVQERQKTEKNIEQPKFKSKVNNNFEDKVENYIENYFKNNYLKIENKQKTEKGISYSVKLNVNELEVDFDCFYFIKKPSEIDIIKFYSSSVKPKILFIQNVPKKLFKLSDNLENLTIINI